MCYENYQCFPLLHVKKMSDLISNFNKLILDSSEENKNTLNGYIWTLKSRKLYFGCESNYFVILDQPGSKLIFCQRMVLATNTFVACLVYEKHAGLSTLNSGWG